MNYPSEKETFQNIVHGYNEENYKKQANLSLFNPLTTELTESAGGTEPTLRPGELDSGDLTFGQNTLCGHIFEHESIN